MSKKEKKVFYWSPFTSKVATVFSVINSAEIINKYSLNSGFKAFIIDAVKEWEVYRKDIHSRNIEIINLNKNSMANDLYEDMRILNSLYEELMWDHDDELQFSIEGDKIIITNLNMTKGAEDASLS